MAHEGHSLGANAGRGTTCDRPAMLLAARVGKPSPVHIKVNAAGPEPAHSIVGPGHWTMPWAPAVAASSAEPGRSDHDQGGNRSDGRQDRGSRTAESSGAAQGHLGGRASLSNVRRGCVSRLASPTRASYRLPPGLFVNITNTAEPDLAAAYQKIRAEGVRVAGGPGDIPQRVALLHSIYVDSGGNHAFPEVALHGALWAYGFYERRGTVNRLISQRYFYDHEERAQRAYMLFTFSQGFKEANRSVFLDTYTNYFFTKAHGETPGADHVLPPQLLDALNRVHHAAHRGRELTRSERGDVFTTALLFEQEKTVGPKVKSEVAKFNCPILTAIVLKPIVRFTYFPRTTFLRFQDFGDTEERIAKAVRSYELAEHVGWDRVSGTIHLHGILPSRCFENPLAYADELRSVQS